MSTETPPRARSELSQAFAVARLEMTSYTRTVWGLLFALLMPSGLFLLATWLWYPHDVWTLAVPHMTVIVVLASGLFSIGVAVTQQRTDGTLKTYLSSPLTPRAYLAGQVIDRVTVTLLGVVVMVLVALLARGVDVEGNPVLFLGCLLVTLAMMISFGFLLAARFTSVEVAGGSSSLLFLLVLFLSGYIPVSLPGWLEGALAWLPFRPTVELLETAWLDASFAGGWRNLAVVAGWTVIFLGLAAKLFRWSRSDR